jgi:hypothetical protein
MAIILLAVVSAVPPALSSFSGAQQMACIAEVGDGAWVEIFAHKLSYWIACTVGATIEVYDGPVVYLTA